MLRVTCARGQAHSHGRTLLGATVLGAFLAFAPLGAVTLAGEPAAADAGQKSAAADEPIEWSCRYERPTGSRKSVKVCRNKKAVEEDAEIARQSVERARHYGNPTVTPGG